MKPDSRAARPADPTVEMKNNATLQCLFDANGPSNGRMHFDLSQSAET
jgi:hypothetical protein